MEIIVRQILALAGSVLFLAIASAAAATSTPNTSGLPPWHFQMTPQEVMAFTEDGPYKSFNNGDLENGPCQTPKPSSGITVEMPARIWSRSVGRCAGRAAQDWTAARTRVRSLLPSHSAAGCGAVYAATAPRAEPKGTPPAR